jgi:hypothetical protein
MTTLDGKGMNVLSKTPEEIKNGLECCGKCNGCHEYCPYYDDIEDSLEECTSNLAIDALVLIQQLERERDAAVEQLKYFNCRTCAHSNLMHIASECCGCENASRWEWRGVTEGNG